MQINQPRPEVHFVVVCVPTFRYWKPPHNSSAARYKTNVLHYIYVSIIGLLYRSIECVAIQSPLQFPSDHVYKHTHKSQPVPAIKYAFRCCMWLTCVPYACARFALYRIYSNGFLFVWTKMNFGHTYEHVLELLPSCIVVIGRWQRVRFIHSQNFHK